MIILAPPFIKINVDSGGNSSWRDENLSGSYHLEEFFDDRPVYKVKQMKIEDCYIFFSGIATLMKVKKCTFTIWCITMSGCLRMVRLLEQKNRLAGWISIHRVRNKVMINQQVV